jgi:hypothetical protein
VENADWHGDWIEQEHVNKRHWKWFHWLKWGDWALYGLIAILAVVLLISAPKAVAGTDAKAIVLEDGAILLEIPADRLQEGGTMNFEANGYHYVLTFEEGSIRFSQADCPDQICVKTGWISRYGQISACAPGHLILKIEGDPENQPTGPTDVDVIVG